LALLAEVEAVKELYLRLVDIRFVTVCGRMPRSHVGSGWYWPWCTWTRHSQSLASLLDWTDGASYEQDIDHGKGMECSLTVWLAKLEW